MCSTSQSIGERKRETFSERPCYYVRLQDIPRWYYIAFQDINPDPAESSCRKSPKPILHASR